MIRKDCRDSSAQQWTEHSFVTDLTSHPQMPTTSHTHRYEEAICPTLRPWRLRRSMYSRLQLAIHRYRQDGEAATTKARRATLRNQTSDLMLLDNWNICRLEDLADMTITIHRPSALSQTGRTRSCSSKHRGSGYSFGRKRCDTPWHRKSASKICCRITSRLCSRGILRTPAMPQHTSRLLSMAPLRNSPQPRRIRPCVYWAR